MVNQQEGRVKKSGLDQDRFRFLKGIHSPVEAHKAIVHYQFKEVFIPKWFISIEWYPFIYDYSTAVSEARHFRNKFLCAILGVKPKRIPQPPLRPRMIWFHERAEILINPQQPKNPKYRLGYHSHLHLEECPGPYTNWDYLNWLIRKRVGKGFKRLAANNSTENKGFVIKAWEWEHHANYNFKDYYRYKGHQDSDLVLDLENSDLSLQRD